MLSQNMGKFSRRLFIMVIVAVFALVVLGGGIFFLYVYNSIKLNARNSLNDLMEQTAVNLDQHISEMDRIALYLSANNAIKQALYELDRIEGMAMRNQQYLKIGHEMITVMIPNSARQFRVCVYGPRGDYIATGNRLSGLASGIQLVNGEYADWYAGLPLIRQRMTLLSPHKDIHSMNDSQVFYSVIREVIDVQTYRVNGVVAVQSPYSGLAEMLSFSESLYIEARVYDAAGKMIFPLAGESVQNDGRIAMETVLPYSGWKLELRQSKNYINTLLLSVAFMLIFACLVIVLFSWASMYMVIKRITKPLRQLNDSVRQINIDNLYIGRDDGGKDDEVSNLRQAFSSMLDNLRKSLDDAINLKAQSFRAHVIALQSHMDPHFLFNAIAVISSAGREAGATAVCDICRAMTDMLRYVGTHDEKLVPLKSEIEHTRKYLELMRFRYESQLDFSFELPPDGAYEHVYVPKLCIQPLAENCFNHGFKKSRPPWEVNIAVRCSGTAWSASISDNGGGFAPGALETAFKRADSFVTRPDELIGSFKIGGMGLANILSRLKLLYGDDMLFTAESDGGKTVVTIGGRTVI